MLAMLIENIKIIAVDINEKAIELAKQNAIKHGVENKQFIFSNLYENVSENSYFYDHFKTPYIANNYILPTNVKYEPSNALFGGDIGDELLKDIIKATNEKNSIFTL